MKALALFFALLTASARANLVLSIAQSPASATLGQVVTVVLEVQNSSPNPVTGITAVMAVSQGSALAQGPASPSSMNLSPGAPPAYFVFTYSMTGCGTAAFSARVTGTEYGSPVSSNQVDSAAFEVSGCSGTPVVIGSTPVSAPAEAKVLGNKFHPAQGGTVGFKVTLPYGGTLKIDIFDRQGLRVKSIIKEGQPGDNLEAWDGRDDAGGYVGTGIYAVRFQGRGLNKVAKIVVIK